jgi:ubiquinone biosynthesis protein UbiJ
MTRVSVEVPAELVRPVRETVLLLLQATAESLHQALEARVEGDAELEEAHSHRRRIDELDDLARELAGDERAVRLSASRDLLHDMLYGALLDAGERLADASGRSWRGELPAARIEAAAEEVLALHRMLGLLESDPEGPSQSGD